MRLHHIQRYWSLEFGQGFLLNNLATSASSETDVWSTERSRCDFVISEGRFRCLFADVTIELCFRDETAGGISFDCIVTNRSSREVRLREVAPCISRDWWGAEGLLAVSSSSLFFQYPAERCYGFEGASTVAMNGPLTSCWFSSLHDPVSGRNIYFGIDGVPAGFVRYRVTPLLATRSGRRVLQWESLIDCHSGMRGVRLDPGASLHLGAQRLEVWEGDHDDGMSRIGGRLGDAFGRRKFFSAPKGWCSWYAGYEGDISRDDVMKNLDAAAVLGSFDLFQVDDGWMQDPGTRCLGEPRIDESKFPGGMRSLAVEIRKRGMRPGLWIRPFQGWGEGDHVPPWARGECLDLSSPETLAWLEQLTRRITADWGYDYIKLDFLGWDLYREWGMKLQTGSMAPVAFQDTSLTTVQLFRRGLEALRRGAGDDTFLLGCNCFVAPAMGLLDGNRIGDDVSAANWERTKIMGARSIPVLRFLHGSVWFNDPDCMLFQQPMTLNQVKLWSGLVAMTAGIRIAGSPLHDLPPARVNLLRNIFQFESASCRIRACDERRLPRVVIADGTYRNMPAEAIGLFNWCDTPLRISLSEHHLGDFITDSSVHDLFTGTEAPLGADKDRVELQPESCIIRVLVREDHA